MPTAHPSHPRRTAPRASPAARGLAACSSWLPCCSRRKQGEDPPPPSAKKLGILLFPGVQVIDFAGPYEVLNGATSKGQKLFDVMTVGLTTRCPRRLDREGHPHAGRRLDRGLPEARHPVIPGGEVGSIEDSPEAMAWVDKTVAGASA
jgi:hypothetical protein